MMEKVTLDDLRKVMKLLSVSLDEERLRIVTPFLNLTMETLRPLASEHLPKELEPTTYAARLKEIGTGKRLEDI
jgi:hypothetical protein